MLRKHRFSCIDIIVVINTYPWAEWKSKRTRAWWHMVNSKAPVRAKKMRHKNIKKIVRCLSSNIKIHSSCAFAWVRSAEHPMGAVVSGRHQQLHHNVVVHCNCTTTYVHSSQQWSLVPIAAPNQTMGWNSRPCSIRIIPTGLTRNTSCTRNTHNKYFWKSRWFTL